MNKGVEKQINKIYNAVYKKVFTAKTLEELMKGGTATTELTLSKFASSEKYNEFAKKFSIELAKRGLASQRGIWRKYFEVAKKTHYIALPKTFSDYEKKIMQKAVEQNFNMIKSIPNEMIKMLNHKYSTTLMQEVVEGKLSRGSFKKQLEKHGITNAKLIARTETAKLQTVIMQERATSLGSIAYTWLASNDKRTRPSHKAMNGVIVFWNHNKPMLDNMIGHAGEFPNCRCSPEPILDEDELTQTRYKVYDYNNHKVIWLTKNELIQSLKEDNLIK